MLDTGFDLTMIESSLADELELERAGRITIIGIAGRERAALYRGAHFTFDGMEYKPRRVAALSQGRRRNRRGILGSSFYRRFVVEVNYQTDKITLHHPENYSYKGSGQLLPLSFDGDTPVVRASLSGPGKGPVRFDFEIDTGCDGGLCLGQDILKNHSWLNADKPLEQSNRNGVGGSVNTFASHIPKLHLGGLEVVMPSANFFKDGSPAGDDQAGHLGCEVLSHFKVIFDYSRKQLILEPLPPDSRGK
jgi:predicted aspartyl protease